MSRGEKFVAGNSDPLKNDSNFNDAAFEAFFKRHFVPLCAYCQYRFGFELEVSKDVVHSAFLKLWEGRESISPDLSLKAYLYKVVTNISIDILKHQKVMDRREKHIVEHNQAAAYNNGFEQADCKQLGNDIDKALSELPDQMRRVFELCRYEGLKYAEVASKLSISVKTVETQMGRALAKLRQKLAHYLMLGLISLQFLNSL